MSGFEDDFLVLSLSWISGISSDGFFFIDVDFVNVVCVVVECGGFNIDVYGLMDFFGILFLYVVGWKWSNLFFNDNEVIVGIVVMYGLCFFRKKGEIGSEGDFDYIFGVKVCFKLRWDNEKGFSDLGFVWMYRGVFGELIWYVFGMWVFVFIVLL